MASTSSSNLNWPIRVSVGLALHSAAARRRGGGAGRARSARALFGAVALLREADRVVTSASGARAPFLASPPPPLSSLCRRARDARWGWHLPPPLTPHPVAPTAAVRALRLAPPPAHPPAAALSSARAPECALTCAEDPFFFLNPRRDALPARAEGGQARQRTAKTRSASGGATAREPMRIATTKRG